jgi:hypothetical protein
MFTIQHDKNARHCKWSYDADAERALPCPHLQAELTPAPRKQLGSSISVLRALHRELRANGLASDALHFDIVPGANHDMIGRRQVNSSAG